MGLLHIVDEFNRIWSTEIVKTFLKKKKKKCQNLCGIFLGMGSSNFSSFTHILDCNLLKDFMVKKMSKSSLKIS